MPVYARAFKLLVHMGKAAQHGLHTALRWMFPAFSKEVLQLLIVQRIYLLKRKPAILKGGQVLFYGIPGGVCLG